MYEVPQYHNAQSNTSRCSRCGGRRGMDLPDSPKSSFRSKFPSTPFIAMRFRAHTDSISVGCGTGWLSMSIRAPQQMLAVRVRGVPLPVACQLSNLSNTVEKMAKAVRAFLASSQNGKRECSKGGSRCPWRGTPPVPMRPYHVGARTAPNRQDDLIFGTYPLASGTSKSPGDAE